MRKMKKINGFLVVRFNDREKRLYPELGSFGVIDAEQYVGDIDIDLDAMEYTDAETIEIAVEQARGLNAEEDYTDQPTTYAVITETSKASREEEVNPQLLIKGWERQLEDHIKSSHFKGVDPRTAAHELYGYKTALCDLGLLDQEDRGVDPDHFAPGMTEQPLPKDSEELLAHICDQVCKHPGQAESQGKLDTKCAECVVGRLMSEAEEREDHIVARAKERLDGLIRELSETQSNTKAQHLEYEARAYLEALATTQVLTRVEFAIYDQTVTQAVLGRPESQEQEEVTRYHAGKPGPSLSDAGAPSKEVFANLHSNRESGKIYTLGLALAEECPDNDCRVYLNIFNAARELDDALDGLKGYPAEILSWELLQRFRELGQMYHENYAVQQFKGGMKA